MALATPDCGVYSCAMPSERQQGGAWPTPQQRLLLRACLGARSLVVNGSKVNARSDAPSTTETRKDWAEWLARVEFDSIDHASLPLLPLLDHRLEGEGASAESVEPLSDAEYASIRGRIRGVRRRTLVVNRRLLAATLPLVRELEQEGCCPVLLRGAALIATTYQDASLRPLHNVDVLVREDRLQRATDLLTRADWLPERRFDPAGLRLRNSVAFTRRPAGGSAEEPAPTLQLHRHVLPDHADPSLDEIARGQACPATLQDQAVSVLDPFHSLLLACGYGISWRPTVSLVWVADTCLLLERHADSIEWPRLLDTALRLGVFTSLRAGLRFVAEELDGPLPPNLRRELDARHPSLEDRLHCWVHSSSLRGSRLSALPSYLLQWQRRGIFAGLRRRPGAT